MGLGARSGEPRGLDSRVIAADVLHDVLSHGVTVDDAIATDGRIAGLEQRDRAFVHNLVLTAFRKKGEIDEVLKAYLARPLPRKSGKAKAILWLAAAQILFLDTPAHAAIDLAVRAAKADHNARHFSGLINAVLRRVADGGKKALDHLNKYRIDTPSWLRDSWERAYGLESARRIAEAHQSEPALDISAKQNPEEWAARLGGELLPTGSIRLPADHPPVTELEGFADGAWWAQDAAAALPAQLCGDVQGKTVLDLCAAPGGKTLQLAARGADVVAVDSSARRLIRLRENLARTGLAARVIEADARKLDELGDFDCVILDAPCSATGTIRRHPELPWIRTPAVVKELAARQRELIVSAASKVKPGGRLVYATCSLEPEESENVVRWFLDQAPPFTLERANFPGLPVHFVSQEGWIRVLPFMEIGRTSGLDGFFSAVMVRRG